MDKIAFDFGYSYADFFLLGFFFGSISVLIDYFLFKLGRYIQLRFIRGLEDD